MFDRMHSPELEDYIFAYDLNITLKKNIPSKKGVWKKQSNIENNRILTDCKCHSHPNKHAL